MIISCIPAGRVTLWMNEIQIRQFTYERRMQEVREWISYQGSVPFYPTKNGVLNITVLIIHTTFLPSSNTMFRFFYFPIRIFVLFSLSTIGLLRPNTKMLFMCRLCTSYLTICTNIRKVAVYIIPLTVCTNIREVAVYIIALCENAASFVKHKKHIACSARNRP